VRADCEIGVASLADGTELDDVTRLLGEQSCLGPGGVSPVVEGLTELGRARRLAELALRTCRPGTESVVRLDRNLTPALVASRSEMTDFLIGEVLGDLLQLDPQDRAVLLDTLIVWVGCEGSAGQAAGLLYCHRNTVFNRLRRLEQLTSRSLSRPRDLAEVVLAVDALRMSSP
jgi:DNA-binding PucR family transcriptional regulator